MDLNMSQNKHFSRKDIPHCSTPKNLSINKNSKSINYNTSYSNNATKIYNSNVNLSNNNLIPQEYTIDNNSDINFYSSSSSLKDQILSPGDDDLYLYSKNTKNNDQKKNQYKHPLINNNIIDKNKQNTINEIDTNYYLNFNMNTANFKSIDNNKKTLILDLDETLVHSSFHPLYFEGELIQPDVFFTILFENKTHDVYVLKRPYIKEFLNKMSKIFNIYIFTASIKEYASPLLIKLDENKLISKALFRENCTLSKDNKYIKDLHILEEDLKNVILIDNNPNSYRYNKCNGLPIKTWHFDKSDKELIKIIPFLTFLALVDDVREYIPKVIDDDQVNYQKIKNIINNSTINNIIKKDNTSKNKRIINKVKRHKIINNTYNNNSNNSNNNNNNSKERIKYYPSYTNNEENKLNITGNKSKRKENISYSINKIHNQNKNEIDYNDVVDKNNFYFSNINFNKLEERKNNNYNNVLNNVKNQHNPATINFREPISHFQSSIFARHKNKVNNNNNKISLNPGNMNINKANRNDENDISKYQRSKSSNNFNELTRTIHKFSSINFNLMNSQSNNKKMKYSIDSKNIQQNNNKQSNDIHQIYENKNMAEKCLSYNNLMNNNRLRDNDLENSFYIENNDPILVTYIQNNNINFNTNNNIMSINLKDNESNKNHLYKEIKENKTQRNNNYNNKLLNRHKSVTNNNAHRNKNILDKKSIKDKINIINNNERKSIKSKKIKKIKNIDNIYNKKNYFNKNMNNFKVNDSKNKKINNILNNYESINYKNYIDENINNDYNFNKKIRSQTLNGRPVSNHRIYTKFEENKNCTMEISKNIKKKFYNNYLKDKDYNEDNSKNKNDAINYNINKQKKNKNNINKKHELFSKEINLLNDYIKDFNKEQSSYLSNYQIFSKEINSQRFPKMGIGRKNINSLINYNYNSEKSINSNSKIKNKHLEEEKERHKDKNISKNEFINKKNYEQYNNKENFYTNFYKRKTKAYAISKETDNCIMEKMKNVNLEDYYSNDIKYENNNDDSDFIKNIKYLSLQKEKMLDKNEKVIKKMKLNNNQGLNNNKNIRRKVSYSYGIKKNMKDLLGSRTINN